MTYWVYILRCADGTLYTGITDCLERRLAAHNSGRGAKYTRGRVPVALVYREACPDKSAALRREYAVKQLSRGGKLALIARGGVTPPGDRHTVQRLPQGGQVVGLVPAPLQLPPDHPAQSPRVAVRAGDMV